MRLVIWGGRDGLDSFRHIMSAFYQTAQKMGIPSVWVNDEPGNRLHAGDVVIAVDIWGKHLPLVDNVDYVMHNYYPDHPVMAGANPQNILRLQVWTTDAFGETWDTYRQFSKEQRILFQPWGTNLLARDFMEPVFNPGSKDVVFIGAVWSDVVNGVELGNEQAIAELKKACAKNNLLFTHKTQVSESEMIHLTRTARLAPTIVGAWQCEHGYIPCRAFKHASYGVPVLTNSTFVANLFEEDSGVFTIESLVEVNLGVSKYDYIGMATNDQQVAKRYTYKESIESILRALEEGRDVPEGSPFLTGERMS